MNVLTALFNRQTIFVMWDKEGKRHQTSLDEADNVTVEGPQLAALTNAQV